MAKKHRQQQRHKKMAEAKLDAILAAVEGLAGRMAALESRVDDLSIKMDVEVCHRLDTLTAKAAFVRKLPFFFWCVFLFILCSAPMGCRSRGWWLRPPLWAQAITSLSVLITQPCFALGPVIVYPTFFFFPVLFHCFGSPFPIFTINNH